MKFKPNRLDGRSTTEVVLSHKAKSEQQLKVGVQILQNVKWHEMDPESKRAHERTLAIISAWRSSNEV